MDFDILIVGAGVTGCAVARVLSRYEGRIAVLDRGYDVAEGASKANSGIIHAGFDAKPGTLKAKLNVEGALMYPQLCKELCVPYSQPGALVIGFDDEAFYRLPDLVLENLTGEDALVMAALVTDNFGRKFMAFDVPYVVRVDTSFETPYLTYPDVVELDRDVEKWEFD